MRKGAPKNHQAKAGDKVNKISQYFPKPSITNSNAKAHTLAEKNNCVFAKSADKEPLTEQVTNIPSRSPESFATKKKSPDYCSNEDLSSPDIIPPTPPQPKRPKMDKLHSSLSNMLIEEAKLKPRVLIPQPAHSANICQTSSVVEPAAKELKIQTSKISEANNHCEDLLVETSVPKEVAPFKKVLKKDLYNLGRHKVVNCEKTENGRELRVEVVPEDDTSISVKKTCILRDLWVNTAIDVGDIVHIHSTWDELFDEDFNVTELVAIINCRSGLIVVRPDVLVSGTSVVSSLFCSRKAVLSERFRGTEPTNQVMLTGTIVHRLFQQVLMEKTYDAPSLLRIVDSLLVDPSTLHSFYGANIRKDDFKRDVVKFVPMVQFFVEKYIHGKNASLPVDANAEKANGKSKYSKPLPMWEGRINSVVDIEENMWSPWLGVKGKVDMTVEVVGKQSSSVTKMPLELKTGRSSFSAEHKGQVTLYSMMMDPPRGSQKSSVTNPSGLLLYLRDGAIQSIPAGHQEKQGLVQLRNEMVRYLTAPTSTSPDGEVIESRLPPRIDRISACSYCPHQVECTIYQVAEDGLNEVQSNTPLALESVTHLSESHREYFLRWSRMLRLEWEETTVRSRSLSSIWCVDPRVREEQGHCISFLKVQNFLPSMCSTSELDQYVITLWLGEGVCLPSHVNLQRGDSVVISTDTEVAVATGCLIEITPQLVTVSTDRNIKNWTRSTAVLHLDKLEYQGGQSFVYSNLSRLMANNPKAAKLRELIIDQRTPEFKVGLPRSVAEKSQSILKSLNELQKRAVLKALTCEDYCLINGLPGTGKTSLIVALIRLAVVLGQSVLLTSYTHSAVDNVLLKLCQFEDANFLRIGREHRTHPSILPYSAEVKSRDCHSVEDLERLYSAPVIAATCLSAGHPALVRRHFDLCIVDEAAQALQLAVIGPLTAANRFVLVGDPLQLPPVVQSRVAKSMGMDESLFVRLSRVTPSAIVPLKLQYRMCAPVNTLANRLTYAGDLECGSASVEQAVLPLTTLADVQHEFADRPWLLRVIQPGLVHAVLFLDTSLLAIDVKAHRSANENDSSGGSSRSPVNHCETRLALLISEAMHKSGLSYEQIGVIAPYQSQVQNLKNAAAKMTGLEINTVDQYQGRDKEAIIYSCTKSEPNEDAALKEGSQTILHDLRRLTVAVTRAKHKLIVIGDSVTLQRYPPFAKLLNALEPHQRYQLCAGRDGFLSSK